MLARRLKPGNIYEIILGGLPSSTCNHSFRATGITSIRNRGRLEDA
jgi:hypothetical protein